MVTISRAAELQALAASIDEEIAAMERVGVSVTLTASLAECARYDARLDRLDAQRRRVRAELRGIEAPASTERVFPNDIERMFPNDIERKIAADKFTALKQRQLNGVVSSFGRRAS